MTDIIERDAVTNTPDTPVEPHEHAHEEMKTIVLVPRADQNILQKAWSWFTDSMKPGIHVIRKNGDLMRYMVLVTSNSYMDRENETITTKALEEYEASCYPGDGLYHNDNPLVYWHDRDVVMGEIVAVNLSGPFLIEVAKEIDTPVARILWDVAEGIVDAGVSHEFGYLSKDRSDDGTYKRIFKQETTWLPKIDYAANGLTYAGVVNMASAASDKWLDETFERIAGVKDASKKLHAKTGELERELAARGLIHKALPPTPAKKPMPPVEADAAATAEAADAVEDMVEEEDDKAEVATADTVPDMQRMLTVLDSFYNMLQTMMDAQAASELDRVGMMKSLDELKEARVTEKSAEKATIEGLEAKVKALEERVMSAEKKLSLAPRSVTHQQGGTADELKVAIDKAEKSRKDGELINDPFWGDMIPLENLPK